MRYISIPTKYIYLTLILPFFSLSLSAQQQTLFLNHTETQWLHHLPQAIKVGITAIPNQVLLSSKGRYKGFSIDLYHIIEKKLGIKFQYVYFDTWEKLIDAAKQRKIDIIFSAQKTPSRLAYLDFTDTVLSQQNKIINNRYDDNYHSLEMLFQHKIAVTQGSAIEEFLASTYPNVILVLVKTELEALQLLNKRVVNAAISESVRASYYMKENNLNNLRIADNLGYDYHLNIASRNDLPLLSIILSKTIIDIPKKQIESLQLKWGYTKDKVIFFDTQTLIYLSIILGIILPFSLYLYLINRNLKKEIEARKKAIDKLEKANHTIEQLREVAEKEARTDELTHVPNKRRFNELLRDELQLFTEHKQKFSLLVLDIDYFKKINDTMGHDIGDIVLEEFAQIVTKCLRPTDHIGRIGGEEFAVILSDTTLNTAITIAEHIRHTVKTYTFILNNHTFSITVSIGVVESKEKDTTKSIIKKADLLLYQSKSEGRDKVSIIPKP